MKQTLLSTVGRHKASGRRVAWQRLLTAACWLLAGNAMAQQVPRVFGVENTGCHLEKPAMPAPDALPVIRELPDALEGVSTFADWAKRRSDIGHMIQHYGIGEKPAVKPEQVKAHMEGDTALVVDVMVDGQTLTLRSTIRYPKHQPSSIDHQPSSIDHQPSVIDHQPSAIDHQPSAIDHRPSAIDHQPSSYALMIGTDMIALPRKLFNDRPIATLNFHSAQVNDYKQFGRHHDRGEHPFDRLYPHLVKNGAYSEWAWGVSRIIDGLEQLGPEVTRIDTRRIGITGCSYAGKMALYAGAFDERIALVIAQEPGGGGAAAWRKSHELTLSGKNLEDIDKTDYHWFLESQKENFGGEGVYRLPYDQHMLCAMVCPRALLLLGNPDFEWLADASMLISAQAAQKVWQQFGIGDRMGYSIVSGHGHCQLPEKQFPEVQAFIDKFLLGKDTDTRNIQISDIE